MTHNVFTIVIENFTGNPSIENDPRVLLHINRLLISLVQSSEFFLSKHKIRMCCEQNDTKPISAKVKTYNTQDIIDDTKGISITISEKWVRKSVTQTYLMLQ